MSGAGAAGTAIARLLTKSGATKIIAFDKDGCVTPGFTGKISDAMKGADVFIGVSAPNVLKEADVAAMAKDAIVLALANPDPEIDPAVAAKHARIVATGRSDYPNQINNVLAFPGIFRGLLDAGVSKITDEMLLAAAVAIASCVKADQLNDSFIIPSVFDPAVTPAVAGAISSLTS